MKNEHQHKDYQGRINGKSHDITALHKNEITQGRHEWTIYYNGKTNEHKS